MQLFHENVEGFEREFHAIITNLAGNTPDSSKQRLKTLIVNNVIDHFYFEEKIVFPIVLGWAKHVRNSSYHKLISGYLEIHRKLLAQAAQVQSAFEAIGEVATKESISPVIIDFAKFNKEFCNHANHENENLVSLLKKNATLRFLSNRQKIAL
jgi:hypothetical protein